MIGYIIIAIFILTIAFLAKREWDWRQKLEVDYGNFLIKNWEATDDQLTDQVRATLRRYAKGAVKEKAYEIQEIMRKANYKAEPSNMATL